MSLSPGSHTFFSPSKNLAFEYLVHSTAPNSTTPSLLLIIQCPAWGLGSSYLQSALQPLLSRAHGPITLVFFHPRGTGLSSRPPSPFPSHMTIPMLASDLDELRIHLYLPAFPVLLGHSHGGAIALSYAEQYPSRVNKLVLIAHPLRSTKTESKTKPKATNSSYVSRLHCAGSDREFTEAVHSLWPLYFYDPSVEHINRLVTDIGKEHCIPRWCHRAVYGYGDECGGEAEEGSGDEHDIIDNLGAVTADTMIIAGREDRACGVDTAERTKDGICRAGGSCRVLVYEECGHFPWIECLQRTMVDLWDFVSS